MISRLQVAAIVLLAVGVFAGAIWLSGDQVSFGWSAYLGATITIVALVITAFNLWLWRLSLLQGWFVRRPHLWGTWRATIKTGWIDPVSGLRREPVEAVFVISQTYAKLHLRMTSDQSTGELLSSTVLVKEDGGFRLAGIYKNEPKLTERESSSHIHYGGFLLDIEGKANAPTRMTGHYWTDRDTKGEMLVEDRRRA